MNLIEILTDRIKGKAPKGAKRSSKWAKVRKEHLKNNPNCEICGTKGTLRVHHKIPFHIAPDMELNKNNLVTLCENKKYGINCHLLLGYIGNFKRINPSCETDIMVWNNKLKNI